MDQSLDLDLVPESTSLVKLEQSFPDHPNVNEKKMNRIFAFSMTSSESVGLVVNVTSVSCLDKGDYLCRFVLKDGREFIDRGRVDILDC